jgi:F0F1-type ATP synthase assembly protein I
MPDNRSNDEEKAGRLSSFSAAGQYAGLGLQFALAVSLFTWVGWKLDHWVGWTPILTIVGAFVGAGGGFYSMYRHLILDPRVGEKGQK